MITVDDVKHPKAKIRRDQMRALGICINASLAIYQSSKRFTRVEHGPVVRGGKCERCLLVWRQSR